MIANFKQVFSFTICVLGKLWEHPWCFGRLLPRLATDQLLFILDSKHGTALIVPSISEQRDELVIFAFPGSGIGSLVEKLEGVKVTGSKN